MTHIIEINFYLFFHMLFNVPARKLKIVLVYVAHTLFLLDSATLQGP